MPDSISESSQNKEEKLSLLKERRIAILGFGSQGSAQAQNLKESGVSVSIGLRENSLSAPLVKKLGFPIQSLSNAVSSSEVILVALPDQIIPQVYKESIQPFLTEGKCLVFCHGFSVHFQQISLPKEIDVIMVSPKGAGKLVRSLFLSGKGVPAFLAVHQDFSGKATNLVLAWAEGIGSNKKEIFFTDFQEETISDLFSEQCLLCGGIPQLIHYAYQVLIEAGYSPNMAYYECFKEVKLIADLLAEKGMSGMWEEISDTAEFGGMQAAETLLPLEIKERMKERLKYLESGEFAKEWMRISQTKEGFEELRAKWKDHPIDKIHRELGSRNKDA